MSNWINWRIAVIRHRGLSSGAKGIALYLNTFMNDRHDFAFPTISTICGEMNMSNKTAIKYLTELESAGMLVKERRYGKSIIYHAAIAPEISREAVDSLSSSVNPPLLEEVHSSCVKVTPSVVEDLHTNKQKNKQENKQSFDLFWKAYPRKEDKKRAMTAFMRLPKKDQDAATQDVQSGRFNGVDKKFIPLPSTYLHGERWNDRTPDKPSNDWLRRGI